MNRLSNKRLDLLIVEVFIGKKLTCSKIVNLSAKIIVVELA